MNRKYYQFGNPFKVRFGEHRCLRCGQKLTTLTDRRIVDPHSEEAKYFDFSAGSGGARWSVTERNDDGGASSGRAARHIM